MPRRPEPSRVHRLLVEGRSDLRIIPELVEKRTGRDWEANGRYWADVREFGGVANLDGPEERGRIEAELQDPRLEAWGLVRDADDAVEPAWNQVRGVLSEYFEENLPQKLPPGGFFGTTTLGKSVGVWVMPDCRGGGMIETLLGDMVPAGGTDAELWKYAATACQTAWKKQAPYKSVHKDKARLHTWLAWQDEPGPQLHEAVRFGKLDVQSEAARGFVEWFEKLFPWHGAEIG